MKKIIITFTVVLVLLLLPTLFRVPLIFQEPALAYADFLDSTDQAEDMLMDPLILAGKSVVPIVLKEVTSENMKLRRYAIHFLGNGKYKEALPTLKIILSNEAEKDYFRGDALASIYNIAPKMGIELAEKYKLQDDYLGKQALEISKGKNRWWVQRTYWEALNNVHH